MGAGGCAVGVAVGVSPPPQGGERQRKERGYSGTQEGRANSNSKHCPAMIPQRFHVGRDVQRESSPYPAVRDLPQRIENARP